MSCHDFVMRRFPGFSGNRKGYTLEGYCIHDIVTVGFMDNGKGNGFGLDARSDKSG